jgi:hypothetical protein
MGCVGVGLLSQNGFYVRRHTSCEYKRSTLGQWERGKQKGRPLCALVAKRRVK